MTMQLNLGAFLTRQGISPARLVRATEGRLAPATVYGLASRPVQRIDLQTVGTVLNALSELTGSEVHFQDVLEALTEAGQQRRQDARSRIGAPHRQGRFQGSPEVVPEGEWSVTDQLGELRERNL